MRHENSFTPAMKGVVWVVLVLTLIAACAWLVGTAVVWVFSPERHPKLSCVVVDDKYLECRKIEIVTLTTTIETFPNGDWRNRNE